MKQLLKGALMLILCVVSMSLSAQFKYSEVIDVKLDKTSYQPVSKFLATETGTVDIKGSTIVIDNVVFECIRKERLESFKDIKYRHLLLTTPKSNTNRLYSCVLSYKQDKLYLVEIWRGDLTCKYYIINI